MKKEVSLAQQALQQGYQQNSRFIPQDQQTLNQLHIRLADRRQKLVAALHQHENANLAHHARTGPLRLQMRGPTLNEAWRSLRAVAGKITRLAPQLPSFMLYNTSDDPALWKPSSSTANTIQRSAEAWHRFRYALGHHLRRHPASIYDEDEADRVEALVKEIDTQHQPEHPLLDSPFDEKELAQTVKSLPPDKSPGTDGITNRMLQSDSPPMQEALFLLLTTVWETETYPADWCVSLMTPVYKGKGKNKADPASYRGIYLTRHVTKLFENLLLSRLQTFSDANNCATQHQFAQKGCQGHDAIYCLMSTIRNNRSTSNSETYCAFIDFETCYPSVHRDRLSLILYQKGIRGKMWRLLRETYRDINVRVLHPQIPTHSTEKILRGLPEGSKLSPILFNIFLSELLLELKTKFPHETTEGTPGPVWSGALGFVDDLCLVSRSPHELQRMIDTCQKWCEKSRMKINVEKTKVVIFTPPSTSFRYQPPPPYTWQLTSSFPHPSAQNIEVVPTFKYLGVTLDSHLNMTAFKDEIITNIKKSGGKMKGVQSDIRTSASNYKSTLGKTATSPLVILRLWSSCVLVHATQYLRYIANPAHINEIQVEINASIQHAMGCHNFPTPLLADLGIPTMEYHRQLDLCRIHFRHTQTQCPKPTSEIYTFRQASKLAVEPK